MCATNMAIASIDLYTLPANCLESSHHLLVVADACQILSICQTIRADPITQVLLNRIQHAVEKLALPEEPMLCHAGNKMPRRRGWSSCLGTSSVVFNSFHLTGAFPMKASAGHRQTPG